MWKYIVKRLLWLIPVVIGVSFLVFVMLDLAPGTVVDIIGEDYSPEEIARITVTVQSPLNEDTSQ